jgi:hypothetical protein
MRTRIFAGLTAGLLAAGLTVAVGGASLGATGSAPSSPTVEPAGDPFSPPCADFNGGSPSYQLTFNGGGIPVALVVTAQPTVEAPTCKGVLYSMNVLGLPVGATYDATNGPTANQFTVPLATAVFQGDGATGTSTPINFTAALSAPFALSCPPPTTTVGSTTTVQSATPCVDPSVFPNVPSTDGNSGPPFVCVFVKAASPQGQGNGALDRAPTTGCIVTPLDPSGSPGNRFS